jgi:hypothetical protein
MLKALLIAGLVIVLVIGGLLALRGSAKTGMPDEAALRRARERAGERDPEDEDD